MRAIVAQRDALLAAAPLTLALSGGKDSMVLLHALVSADIPVQAVHVHHGLQPQADAWADVCQTVSASLGVSCAVKRVTINKQARRGLEACAREARYAALWEDVPASGALLTAHHQRDQAETFLLRLLRGAGVKGLSAMQASVVYDQGRRLIRPLLSVRYADITDYAQQQGLRWVEDPSNLDTHFARNAIRHHILPQLTPQQPELATRMIAQTCQRLAESHALLEMMAAEDWQRLAISEWRCDLSEWRSLPWIRAKQVLSWQWQQLGGATLQQAHWKVIEHQFYQPIAQDKHPQLSWQHQHLLLGAGGLWFLPNDFIEEITSFLAEKKPQFWGKWGSILLSYPQVIHSQGWYWRMRQQEDAVMTVSGKKTLKHWLQTQYHLPHWQKQRWPVLCDAQGQVLGWANMPASWWSVSMSATLVICV